MNLLDNNEIVKSPSGQSASHLSERHITTRTHLRWRQAVEKVGSHERSFVHPSTYNPHLVLRWVALEEVSDSFSTVILCEYPNNTHWLT